MLHKTPAGYVAVPGDRPARDITELQLSTTVQRVRKTVGLGGIVLFLAVLIAVTVSSDGHFLFPIVGIMFVLAIFAYRTLDLWCGHAYRRQLSAEQEAGRLVIVPDGLIIQAGATCRELDKRMSNSLFDYDIARSRLLVKAYQEDGRSPDVQKQLSTLIERSAIERSAGAPAAELPTQAAPHEDSSAAS
jgi:hypothetical protein